MNLVNKLIAALLGSVLFMSLQGCGGCTSKLGEYRVKVSLGSDIPSTILVDLVGVPAGAELDKLKSLTAASYFENQDNVRDSYVTARPYRVVSKTLDPAGGEQGRTIELSLTRRDELYKQWARDGVLNLVIMADIRRVSGATGADAGRGVLSLDKCDWGSRTAPLDVTIFKGPVSVPVPPPKK